MKGSDVLLELLLSEGVRHVFGNPGTTELPLMNALSRASGEVRYMLGLQESVVVGMADGYAQATGRPALASLHAEAGLGNAMGNLTNARVAGTPLVVLAGQADQRHLVGDPLLAGDLTRLAGPVAKWAHEVRRVEDLAPIIRRAFHDAAAAPTGPVFVSVPVDVLDQEDAREAALRLPPVSQVRQTPHAAAIGELATLVLDTEPPELAIVVTDEVAQQSAVGEATALAEALGARVYGSSLHASTVFPTTHPLWAGQLGLSAAEIRQTLQAFRRVLVLGGRPFLAYGYTPGPVIPPHVEMLQITLDLHQLGRSFPTRLGLAGHLRTTLAELTTTLGQCGNSRPARAAIEELDAVHRRARERQEEAALHVYGDRPTPAVAAVHALLHALPADITVVDESMTCDEHVRAFHRVTRAGRYFAARGGGLGWGMPAALGISLGHGREPVLCVVGDGSAMYSPQALWSAAHEGLPVLFAVMNNSQYLMLKRGLTRRYGDAVVPVGMDVDRPPVDFVALARSMGVRAERIESAADIPAAAQAAWDSGQPCLLDLPIAA
ncbi:thiamine pyrophosphate-binding protein [[Actinomadura] parvosata]|uniref:thiamine pyrophosphate-binding protein n=1 Tax=[Actinomadura] parvosata TaxID=1955412 RepID=UPI00406CA314